MFGIQERRELDLITGKYLLSIEQQSFDIWPKILCAAPTIFQTDTQKAQMRQHLKAAVAVCIIMATKLSKSHSKYVNHVMGTLAKSAPSIFEICSRDYLSLVLMQFYLDKRNENLCHVFKTVATHAILSASGQSAEQIDKREFSSTFTITMDFLDDETSSLTQPTLKFDRGAIAPQNYATNNRTERQTQNSDNSTQTNTSKIQIKEMANNAGAILKEYLAIHNGAFKGRIFAERHIDLRETESVKLHLTHLRQKIEAFSKDAQSIPEDQAIYLDILLNYVCALQNTVGILEQAQKVMSSTRVPGLKEAKAMHEEYEQSIQNYQTIGKELIARARTIYS